MTQRVYVIPPGGQIGPITGEQRQRLIAGSLVAGVYDKAVDRESAFEKLQARAAGQGTAPTAGADQQPEQLLVGNAASQTCIDLVFLQGWRACANC